MRRRNCFCVEQSNQKPESAIRSPNMAVITIDLGGTKLATGIVKSRGEMRHKSVVPLAGRQGRAVGDLICQEIARLLGIARAERTQLSAIGICIPGISYSRTGKVWAPNIPGWEAYPLRRQIQALVRPIGLQVVIESDRAAYILGEAWRGAAKGCRNAIFLAVGTGIGAGILIEGKVLRGAHDIAGAAGWLALDRPFRNEYSACGCFEYHASGEGLVKVANDLLTHPNLPPFQHSTISPFQPSPAPFSTAHDLFAAYDRGELVARQVLVRAIEFWGMAVANLVSLFNPEKIIFGGGVFGPATRFLEDIHAEARRWAQPISIERVKLLPSQLGSEAGLYGAGYLAVQAAARSQRV